MDTLAILTIVTGAASLLCLLALHFVSPEFSPGWRMVSEYALGKHKWVLTMFFWLWGACSILSACFLWSMVTAGWARFGTILIFITGIGAIMGGLFDVKHKLHGLAFGLGVPFLPVGALLVSYHLIRNEAWNSHSVTVLLSAHSTWISVLLMGFSMMLLFSGFKKAGVPTGPDIEPPATLPEGVMGVNGYVNRFLIACYIAWPVWIAKIYLSF
jgi:hypothetical membrane protein